MTEVLGEQTSFQPNVQYIPARVKELRTSQPDVCWRPNHDWRNVCVKPLAHEGPCGWEKEEEE